MRYVEAVEPWEAGPGEVAVFLAGGITSCPRWQDYVVERLSMVDGLLLVNPRQASFNLDNPDAAVAQVHWEHDALRRVDVAAFWFCAASVCPIVLYELGAWSAGDRPMAVGHEPGYVRKLDVRVQTALARPDVRVGTDLNTLCADVVQAAFRLVNH